MLLNDTLHPALLLPINGDGQDLQLISLPFRELFQKYNVLFTGDAPCSPEEEKDGFPLISIQIFSISSKGGTQPNAKIYPKPRQYSLEKRA